MGTIVHTSKTAMAPAVLYLGLHPTSPGLQEAAKKGGLNLPPPDQFLAKLNEEVDRVSQAGYACEGLWVMDSGEEGVKETIAKLKEKDYKAICIGFGIRGMAPFTVFFEQLVSAITSQTSVPMCFNSSPNDSLEAIQRVVKL